MQDSTNNFQQPNTTPSNIWKALVCGVAAAIISGLLWGVTVFYFRIPSFAAVAVGCIIGGVFCYYIPRASFRSRISAAILAVCAILLGKFYIFQQIIAPPAPFGFLTTVDELQDYAGNDERHQIAWIYLDKIENNLFFRPVEECVKQKLSYQQVAKISVPKWEATQKLYQAMSDEEKNKLKETIDKANLLKWLFLHEISEKRKSSDSSAPKENTDLDANSPHCSDEDLEIAWRIARDLRQMSEEKRNAIFQEMDQSYAPWRQRVRHNLWYHACKKIFGMFDIINFLFAFGIAFYAAGWKKDNINGSKVTDNTDEGETACVE